MTGNDDSNAVVPIEYMPEIEVVLPAVSIIRLPSVFQTVGTRTRTGSGGTNEPTSPSKSGFGAPIRKNSGNAPHKRFFVTDVNGIDGANNGGSENFSSTSSALSGLENAPISPRSLPTAPRGRRVTNYFILRSSQMHYPSHVSSMPSADNAHDSSEGSEIEREKEKELSKKTRKASKSGTAEKPATEENEEILETEEKVRLEMSKILNETTAEPLTIEGIEGIDELEEKPIRTSLLLDSPTKIIPLLERESTMSAIQAADDANKAGTTELEDNNNNTLTSSPPSSPKKNEELISVEFQGSIEAAAKLAMQKQQQQQDELESTTTAISTQTATNGPTKTASGKGLLSNSGQARSHLNTSGKDGGSGFTGWELTNKETTERKYRDCLNSKRNHYLTLPVVITASIFAGMITSHLLLCNFRFFFSRS
jgi:hypothetical protein